MTPVERWRADEHLVKRVSPEDIRRALMVRADRKVNQRTAQIRLDSQWYQANPELAGSVVEVRWHAGSTDEIEVWRNGVHFGNAPVTTPRADIDFARKPPKPPAQIRGLPFESSKKYRQSLLEQHLGEAPLTAKEPDDYLSQPEFTKLIVDLLQRSLEQEEMVFLSQFFLQCSPLRTRRTSALLDQAVNAKGTKMHLRYYLEHIRRSTFQTRR